MSESIEVFSTDKKPEFNKVLRLLRDESIAVDLDANPARTKIIAKRGFKQPHPFFICVRSTDVERVRELIDQYLQALPPPERTPGNDLTIIVLFAIAVGACYALYVGMRTILSQ